MRGALDTKRMTLVPELTGPRRLETRIDRVALDDGELDLYKRKVIEIASDEGL